MHCTQTRAVAREPSQETGAEEIDAGWHRCTGGASGTLQRSLNDGAPPFGLFAQQLSQLGATFLKGQVPRRL